MTFLCTLFNQLLPKVFFDFISRKRFKRRPPLPLPPRTLHVAAICVLWGFCEKPRSNEIDRILCRFDFDVDFDILGWNYVGWRKNWMQINTMWNWDKFLVLWSLERAEVSHYNTLYTQFIARLVNFLAWHCDVWAWVRYGGRMPSRVVRRGHKVWSFVTFVVTVICIDLFFKCYNYAVQV